MRVSEWVENGCVLAIIMAVCACGSSEPGTTVMVIECADGHAGDAESSADGTTPDAVVLTDVEASDTRVSVDTAPEHDTAVEDTAVEDTAVEDTAVEDAAVEDTAVEDTAVDDVSPDDVGSDDVGSDDVAIEDATTEDAATDDASEDVDIDVPEVITIGTFEDPAAHCLDLQEQWPDAPSGSYWIDGAEGPDSPIEVWCDQDYLGGGWTLVSNRPYAPVPGPWGVFETPPDGAPTPETEYVLPFLSLDLPAGEVVIALAGFDTSVYEPIAPDFEWESAANGARIRLTDGRYLIFADQPAAVSQAVCFSPGNFDTGYKCDGNGGQLDQTQGLLSAFAEDEVCNCGTHGFKTLITGCEVAACAPESLVQVYLR